MTLTDDLELGINGLGTKGLVRRYSHVKYEGPNSYQSKDMASVKVFVDKRTDKWTNGRTAQKLYAPDLSMRGHKNEMIVPSKLSNEVDQFLVGNFPESRARVDL